MVSKKSNPTRYTWADFRERRRTTGASTTKKPVDDKLKPSTFKDMRSSKSKLEKSLLDDTIPGGDSGPNSVGKKRVVTPEPAEADSKKGEEWIGFGHASGESCEED